MSIVGISISVIAAACAFALGYLLGHSQGVEDEREEALDREFYRR